MTMKEECLDSEKLYPGREGDAYLGGAMEHKICISCAGADVGTAENLRGRVSDRNFGLAAFHALVGVTTGQSRGMLLAHSLSAGDLNIACRGVKCTSETRPLRFIAAEKVEHPEKRPALTPSLFGVPGRAMPHRRRRFNRHSRDHYHRSAHLYTGWRDCT